MTCQILNRLRIHACVDQVRDIGVPEEMRCHIEIYRIYYVWSVVATLAKFRFHCFLDRLTIHILIKYVRKLQPADIVG